MDYLWDPRKSLPGKVRRGRAFERSLIRGFLDDLETSLRQSNRISVSLSFFIVFSMIAGIVVCPLLWLLLLVWKAFIPWF